MRFRVLGPLALEDAGVLTEVRGRLQQRLLATLLCAGELPVSHARLCENMWGHATGSNERLVARLHLHVHRLRGILDDGERILGEAANYRIHLGEDDLDSRSFETLSATALSENVDSSDRAAAARSALGLWRDPWRSWAYEGIDIPGVEDEAARLSRLRDAVVQAHFRAQIDIGRHSQILPRLQSSAGEHPFDEALQELLMDCLYRCGRRDEALEVYRSARHAMIDELGVEPGEALRAKHMFVLSSAGQPPPPQRKVPAQLPPVPKSFAREDELTLLDDLLCDDTSASVVVLTGVPGVGKTSLALNWAARAREQFPDGQLFVDMHGYSQSAPPSVEEVLSRFVRALGGDTSGLRGIDELSATYRSLLAGRRVLVVIDNVAMTAGVHALLPGSPGCAVIVTARERLRGLQLQDGAEVVEVEPLSVAASIALLREETGTDDVDEQRWQEVAELCAGIPLALRIAALRIGEIPHAPLPDVHDEVGLLDWFDSGDVWHNGRTIISWSVERLTDVESRVYTALGVVPASRIEEAVLAAMTGIDPAQVAAAVRTLDRARLVFSRSGFVVQHDLLAAYSRELASVLPAEAATGMHTAALEHFALRLREGVAELEQALIDKDDELVERKQKWLHRSIPAMLAAIDTAPRSAERAALDLCLELEPLLRLRGESFHSTHLCEIAVDFAHRLGDLGAESRALSALGTRRNRAGRTQDGDRHLDEAIALARRSQDPIRLASALNNKGISLHRRGEFLAALDLLEQCIALCARQKDWNRWHVASVNSIDMLVRLGRFEESRARMEAVEERTLAQQQDQGGAKVDSGSRPVALFNASEIPRLATSRAYMSVFMPDPMPLTEVDRILAATSRDVVGWEEFSDLLWTRGYCALFAKAPAEAVDSFSEAAETARTVDSQDQLVEALIGLAHAQFLADREAWADTIEEAIARADRFDLVELQSRGLFLLSGMLAEGKQEFRARSCANRARELVRESEPLLLSLALHPTMRIAPLDPSILEPGVAAAG